VTSVGTNGPRPEPPKPETLKQVETPEAPSKVDPTLTALQDLKKMLRGVTDRLADLEDAVAESTEGIVQLKKSLRMMGKAVATRKDLKKLKKILDQLEVVEVGDEVYEEGGPSPLEETSRVEHGAGGRQEPPGPGGHGPKEQD